MSTIGIGKNKISKPVCLDHPPNTSKKLKQQGHLLAPKGTTFVGSTELTVVSDLPASRVRAPIKFSEI